ncbi:hypothetical protein F5879DRAFT_939068 [Lentinula edodes]|nr:hypothetical protein F5879DRAFT_939068 [Lentinula edodes]
MLTGLEIPIIAALTGKAISTFKFSRTSVLIDQTRDILNDDHLTKSLILLYELDPRLAVENDKRRQQAQNTFHKLDRMKGRKYILIRHISARNAKSLAAQYRNVVNDNTTEAKIQQAREKARMREQIDITQTITVSVVFCRSFHIHMRLTEYPNFRSGSCCSQLVPKTQTPKYIIQTSDMAAFAYPRGTPENPTVSCPVCILLQVSSSHPFIAINLAITRRNDQFKLVEDIIREDLQDIAGTAHFIGTLRAANGSDGDVASIATTYLSFDDTNAESGSDFGSEAVDDDV